MVSCKRLVVWVSFTKCHDDSVEWGVRDIQQVPVLVYLEENSPFRQGDLPRKQNQACILTRPPCLWEFSHKEGNLAPFWKALPPRLGSEAHDFWSPASHIKLTCHTSAPWLKPLYIILFCNACGSVLARRATQFSNPFTFNICLLLCY